MSRDRASDGRQRAACLGHPAWSFSDRQMCEAGLLPRNGNTSAASPSTMARRPFDRQHVLGRTKHGIKNAIGFSIRKTIERIAEYENDPNTSREIAQTLGILRGLERDVTWFLENHSINKI